MPGRLLTKGRGRCCCCWTCCCWCFAEVRWGGIGSQLSSAARLGCPGSGSKARGATWAECNQTGQARNGEGRRGRGRGHAPAPAHAQAQTGTRHEVLPSPEIPMRAAIKKHNTMHHHPPLAYSSIQHGSSPLLSGHKSSTQMHLTGTRPPVRVDWPFDWAAAPRMTPAASACTSLETIQTTPSHSSTYARA